MTTLTSSNGSSNAPIYQCERMPRLKDGEAAAETREIIGIDGPPCQSIGIQVETSPSLAGFRYGKQFQGYIWGEHANKTNAIVADAHEKGHVMHTPAYNYVPYYSVASDGTQRQTMDLAVAMLDPEFRADVEKLEAACADPEQRNALTFSLETQRILETVERIIDQAEQIISSVPGDSA